MNPIKWSDVILTAFVGLVLILGLAFEFAGETVKGWHTISWWAHRERWLRWLILGGVLVLFVLLVFHFASNNILR